MKSFASTLMQQFSTQVPARAPVVVIESSALVELLRNGEMTTLGMAEELGVRPVRLIKRLRTLERNGVIKEVGRVWSGFNTGRPSVVWELV